MIQLEIEQVFFVPPLANLAMKDHNEHNNDYLWLSIVRTAIWT